MEKTLLGLVLPGSWKKTGAFGPTGATYERRDGLVVIETTARQDDGREWLHVSMSYPDRLPAYEDMATVKRLFVGPDRRAIQVFPAAVYHVNIHDFCLHLWCCLSPRGDGLPEFGARGSI